MNDSNKSGKILNFVLIVFFLSLVIPFAAFIIEIFSNNYNIDLDGIVRIHKLNRSLFIIDLIPFIAVLAGYFISKFYFDKIDSLKVNIDSNDQMFKKTLDFINKLVEGNTNVELDVKNENDVIMNFEDLPQVGDTI